MIYRPTAIGWSRYYLVTIMNFFLQKEQDNNKEIIADLLKALKSFKRTNTHSVYYLRNWSTPSFPLRVSKLGLNSDCNETMFSP